MVRIEAQAATSAAAARDMLRDELWAAKGKRGLLTLDDKDWEESNTRRKNYKEGEDVNDNDNDGRSDEDGAAFDDDA